MDHKSRCKLFYEKNKKKIRKKQTEYYQHNKDRIRERQRRKYYEKKKKQSTINRLFKKTSGSKRIHLRWVIKKHIMYRQKYNCNICHQILPIDHHFDHIVPLAQNGTNHISNLQALCVPCHVEKTSWEQQLRYENQREKKTGVSKYFREDSLFFNVLS